MNDEQLLADFLSHRDGSAFEALVGRYGPMVLRVCRDLLGDHEFADDAFQATFLVLARQAASIRDRGSVGRWLYEVACRISKRERRRLARLRSQERQAPEMEAAAPPDFDPADREWKPILHEEIGRLPSKLRDAIVLCYFEGLTVHAAAGRLGCPVGTLKSRLGKGRELLRSRLTRRGLAASILFLLMFSLTEESSASVPDSLLDSTLKAGPHRQGTVGVSPRVASMIQREVARSRLARMMASWTLLVALLVIFGGTRIALGLAAEGAQPAPLAIFPAGPAAIPSASIALPPGSSRDLAPGEHCKAQ
jgi:polysaccharide export outer membrane protein